MWTLTTTTVVIATDRSSIDYRWIAECAPCVVDARNAMNDANGYRHQGRHAVTTGTRPSLKTIRSR